MRGCFLCVRASEATNEVNDKRHYEGIILRLRIFAFAFVPAIIRRCLEETRKRLHLLLEVLCFKLLSYCIRKGEAKMMNLEKRFFCVVIRKGEFAMINL